MRNLNRSGSETEEDCGEDAEQCCGWLLQMAEVL